MTDLSTTHRTALRELMRQRADGTWVPYPGVATNFIRGALDHAAWTAREVLDLMHRLSQAGLVEPAGRSSSGAVLVWRITAAGVAALALEAGDHGVGGADGRPLAIAGGDR